MKQLSCENWLCQASCKLMKIRTRNYGRNFCTNVEMECIVVCALAVGPEYRETGPVYKKKSFKNRHMCLFVTTFTGQSEGRT